MIKNILSIDFDYIMYPCIRLYNDMTAGGENSTAIWYNIENNRGVDEKFLSYDATTYKTIVKLIKFITERYPNVKLYPIKEHEEIVDNLKKLPNYDESKFNITNIDFHHDIMYRPQDRAQMINFKKYNCSNWAGYLILNDKIENYTWIKAPNSDMYDHRLDGKYKVEFKTESMRFITDDINKFIDDSNFDSIYLCLSPQWVPSKFAHLYELIIELFGASSREE